MTKKDAYELGVQSATEAIEYGDFSAEEKEDEDSFREAFWEIEENKQQYDDYTEMASEFNKSRNSEALWEEFGRGEPDTLDQYVEENFE